MGEGVKKNCVAPFMDDPLIISDKHYEYFEVEVSKCFLPTSKWVFVITNFILRFKLFGDILLNIWY